MKEWGKLGEKYTCKDIVTKLVQYQQLNVILHQPEPTLLTPELELALSVRLRLRQQSRYRHTAA